MNGASRRLSFADNGICAMLFGQHHMNVARIEQRLSVSLVTRGNEVFIQGEADGDVAAAADVLQSLYSLLEQGHVIGHEDVDAALRMVVGDHPVSLDDRRHFKTERRAVKPRSPNQAAYLSALERHDLVFALGPAGTGKTYLAVAAAVAMLKERRIDRLILSRPAVEAGERLGFLPGDLKEKVDPYLRPLYDA
ncbi:MAG: PhoH family protein, partial [Geminicoccaceae bacterium]|nr:PhoH family protein [Geminicoccaceae bacterium]